MNRKNCFRAIWLLFLSLSPAFAQSDNDLAAYREAGLKFALLVAEAERGTGPKGLQTAEVDLIVAVLSDEKRFLKIEQYTGKELESVLDLCGMSNRAIMSLALFSLKEHVDPKASPETITVQVAALMQKNLESFSRHLRYLQPFLIRCLAKQVPPMTEFVRSLPAAQFTDVRREGLQQFRNGLAQAFVSVAQSLGNPGSDEAYRLALVQALAESAPSLVSALPVALRLQIRSIINPSAESSPPRFAAYLQKIYEALNDNSCDGLCGI